MSIFKIVSYLFIKYLIYFFILAFIGKRFEEAVLQNAETSYEIVKLSIGYILYVLSYTLILTLLLCGPLYGIFKISHKVWFLALLVVFFVLEYFIYTYWFSPSDKILGVYNFIIGVVVFVGFFYKSLLNLKHN